MGESTSVYNYSESSVELTKNSRGYAWKIKIYAEDVELMITQISKIDKQLREKYGEDWVKKDEKL